MGLGSEPATHQLVMQVSQKHYQWMCLTQRSCLRLVLLEISQLGSKKSWEQCGPKATQQKFKHPHNKNSIITCAQQSTFWWISKTFHVVRHDSWHIGSLSSFSSLHVADLKTWELAGNYSNIPKTASVFGTVPKIARSCTDYSKNCELSITRTVVNIVGVAAQSFPRDRRQAQQTTTLQSRGGCCPSSCILWGREDQLAG